MRLTKPQHRVKFARRIQRVNVIATTDMRTIDENLRHGGAPPSPIAHFHAATRLGNYINLGKYHPFFTQQ